jgi:hypothetical protein
LRSKPPDERLPLLLAARFAVRGKEEDGERNEMEWAEEGERERERERGSGAGSGAERLTVRLG